MALIHLAGRYVSPVVRDQRDPWTGRRGPQGQPERTLLGALADALGMSIATPQAGGDGGGRGRLLPGGGMTFTITRTGPRFGNEQPGVAWNQPQFTGNTTAGGRPVGPQMVPTPVQRPVQYPKRPAASLPRPVFQPTPPPQEGPVGATIVTQPREVRPPASTPNSSATEPRSSGPSTPAVPSSPLPGPARQVAEAQAAPSPGSAGPLLAAAAVMAALYFGT